MSDYEFENFTNWILLFMWCKILLCDFLNLASKNFETGSMNIDKFCF